LALVGGQGDVRNAKVASSYLLVPISVTVVVAATFGAWRDGNSPAIGR
jgi:hypothetical protein